MRQQEEASKWPDVVAWAVILFTILYIGQGVLEWNGILRWRY